MSDVELVKFARNDHLDSPEIVLDQATNGDLTVDKGPEELELVCLDKDGYGLPKYSVRFSHKAAPETDASETETENLLQKVITE